MKRLTIKTRDKIWNRGVLDLSKQYGFTVSNPEQVNGDFIDLIIEDGAKISGMDLFAIDSLRNVYEVLNTDDITLIKDWLEDHVSPTT